MKEYYINMSAFPKRPPGVLIPDIGRKEMEALRKSRVLNKREKRSISEKRSHISKRSKSGKSKSQYAKENGILYRTFMERPKLFIK